jgi:hypothetical protein
MGDRYRKGGRLIFTLARRDDHERIITVSARHRVRRNPRRRFVIVSSDKFTCAPNFSLAVLDHARRIRG